LADRHEFAFYAKAAPVVKLSPEKRVDRLARNDRQPTVNGCVDTVGRLSEATQLLKKQEYVRRHWPTLQVPLLGIAIGMTLFLGVHAISPHPGQSCERLGQITEEWELGMATRPLICGATLDGDLRYGRAITTEKKTALR
jgi:hypothetical protein